MSMLPGITLMDQTMSKLIKLYSIKLLCKQIFFTYTNFSIN